MNFHEIWSFILNFEYNIFFPLIRTKSKELTIFNWMKAVMFTTLPYYTTLGQNATDLSCFPSSCFIWLAWACSISLVKDSCCSVICCFFMAQISFLCFSIISDHCSTWLATASFTSASFDTSFLLPKKKC